MTFCFPRLRSMLVVFLKELVLPALAMVCWTNERRRRKKEQLTACPDVDSTAEVVCHEAMSKGRIPQIMALTGGSVVARDRGL